MLNEKKGVSQLLPSKCWRDLQPVGKLLTYTLRILTAEKIRIYFFQQQKKKVRQ